METLHEGTVALPRVTINSRRATLASLFVAYELTSWFIGRSGTMLDMQTWFLLALAASTCGRAISYMVIGEWIREPFTKVVEHSSGAGKDVEAKYEEGALGAISNLIACPICSSAWSALGLLIFFSFFPIEAMITIKLFAAISVAWFVIRMTEFVEASTWVMRELNGKFHKENEPEES